MKLTKQKLKEMIKEELMNEASYSSKEVKNIITEKKELSANFVKQIAQMTDRNNHTLARFQLSKYLGNDSLALYYSSAENINKVFGNTPQELSKLNQKMEKELYKQIQRTYSNAKDIIGSL